MDIRRATYGAAVRLAFVFSVVAALSAMALDVVGDVSTTRLLVVVALIGFSTSWVQTGRVAREAEAVHPQRLTVMSAGRPTG